MNPLSSVDVPLPAHRTGNLGLSRSRLEWATRRMAVPPAAMAALSRAHVDACVGTGGVDGGVVTWMMDTGVSAFGRGRLCDGGIVHNGLRYMDCY